MNQGSSSKKLPEWASGGSASLFLVGALHVGIFAFATGQVGSESAPLLGFWILGVSIALLMLAIIELRRGEVVFGTFGMVFGGLLGLGGGLSFVRTMWMPGVFAIDGWWFFSAGVIIILLLPSVFKVSRIMFGGSIVIGITLMILGLGLMGIFGPSDTPLKVAGWMALFYGVFSWYGATAILTNTVYGKQILPF